MNIQHSVLPLFGDEPGFRAFTELLHKQGAPLGESLPKTLAWVLAKIADPEIVSAYREINRGFQGGPRAAQRLLHLYAPALALGFGQKPQTLRDALIQYDGFSKAFDYGAQRGNLSQGLNLVLTTSELSALRMLCFNQLTTPMLLRMVGKEATFSAGDQAALLQFYDYWLVFNDEKNFRHKLEQMKSYSTREANAGHWSVMNWVVFQPVRLKDEDPLTWGRSLEYANQPLFRAFEPMLHDFAFVTTAFSKESILGHARQDAAQHLDQRIVMQLEALARFRSGGEEALDDYLNPKAMLRIDDLHPGGRRGRKLDGTETKIPAKLPLRARALLSLFEEWKAEYSKDSVYEPPSRNEKEVKDEARKNRLGGFFLELDKAFQPVEPNDHVGLTHLVTYLLDRRLLRMQDFVQVLVQEAASTDEEGSLKKSQEIADACSKEGLVPPAPAFSTESQGPRANGLFWSSILARGQQDISPQKLSELMKYFGRVGFSFALDEELRRVIPAKDQPELHRAIFDTLEKISQETNLKNVRVEQLFLSAAVRVSMTGKFPGFGLPEAYATAYRMGMGSSTDGFGDFSKAHYDAVASRYYKATAPSFGLMEGEAGVYVSIFSQWRRKLKEAKVGDEDMKRVFQLPASLTAAFPKKEALGTLLGEPSFWRQVMDEAYVKNHLKGFRSGLLSDFLKKTPIPMGVSGPLNAEFSQYLDGVGRRVGATGVKLMPEDVRLTPVSERNEKFLSVGARVLAPQLDYLSKCEIGKTMKAFTLPELYQEILSMTVNPITLQTHGRDTDFAVAFDRVHGDMLANYPALMVNKLHLKMDDIPVASGVGNTKFVEWLKNPHTNVAFYAALAEAPGVRSSAEAVAKLQAEFLVPPAESQALYRAHHALTLLREAARERKDAVGTVIPALDLPEHVVRQMDYLRERTALYLAGVKGSKHGGVAPNTALRMELANNYKVLAEQLPTLISSEKLHEGLRVSYARRLGAGLLVQAADSLGAKFQIDKKTRRHVDNSRNVLVVHQLYNALCTFSESLPEHANGCLNLSSRFLPFTAEETRDFITRMVDPERAVDLDHAEIA